MQKLRFAHFQVIVENLVQIFINKKQADKIIPISIKNPKFGSKDRKFIASSSYDIVRNWKLLYSNYQDFGVPKKYELTQVIYNYYISQDFELPDWPELKNLSEDSYQDRINSNDISILNSFPDWLSNKIKTTYPDNYEEMIKALSEKAEVLIRINTTLTNTKEVQEQLLSEGISSEVIANYPDALRIIDRPKLTNTKAYQKGLFEIQDLGSQEIAPFLGPVTGDYVIDACSGAGGKSLHLADLMKNDGKISSMDIHDFKLKELRNRAKRNQVSIIETTLIKGKSSLNKYFSKADKLLLDVPCSGTGVLKRNPDSKWKLTPNFIEEIKSTQSYILEQYSKMLKPGGLLVYATCSVLPEENELQVNNFLLKYSNYKKIKETYKYPTDNLSDGYYMALIQKE